MGLSPPSGAKSITWISVDGSGFWAFVVELSSLSEPDAYDSWSSLSSPLSEWSVSLLDEDDSSPSSRSSLFAEEGCFSLSDSSAGLLL